MSFEGEIIIYTLRSLQVFCCQMYKKQIEWCGKNQIYTGWINKSLCNK